MATVIITETTDTHLPNPAITGTGYRTLIEALRLEYAAGGISASAYAELYRIALGFEPNAIEIIERHVITSSNRPRAAWVRYTTRKTSMARLIAESPHIGTTP